MKINLYDTVLGTLTIITTFSLISTIFLYTLNFYILLLLVPIYAIFTKYYGSPNLSKTNKFLTLIVLHAFIFSIVTIDIACVVPLVKTQKSYKIKVVKLLKDKLIYDVKNTTEVKEISELEFYKLNYCLSENKHLELVIYKNKRWAIKSTDVQIQCKK